MDRNIYDILEDITNAYYCELVASDLRDDVLNILEDELMNDLEYILYKIIRYGKCIRDNSNK